LSINETVILKSGEKHVINKATTMPAGPDPFVNMASVQCSPEGFANVLKATDSWSVNLFQPSITFDKKAGNPYSKVGDDVAYTITLNNTSSTDTPDLECTITDAKLGINKSVTLASGKSDVTNVSYTVHEDDDTGEPGAQLTNSASVSCSPTGFPNTLIDEKSVSVTLLHPSFTVAKTCTNEPVPLAGPATWDVVIENTGDVELVVTADDGIGTFNLAAGASQTFPVSAAGPFSGQETVYNSVTASWVLPEMYGLSNTEKKLASDACQVGSRVNLLKLTQGSVDPNTEWTFGIYDGPNASSAEPGGDSSFLNAPLATDSTSGDADGILDFDNFNFDPDNTYTICELGIPAGWSVFWMVDRDGDGVAETTIVPYNPNLSDVPPEDLGNRCWDFGAGEVDKLTAGGTLVFQVDNQFPGGEPRTPGYWKNWNTCTGGNQQFTATANAEDIDGDGEIEGWERVASGWALLDDILNDPGITWGEFTIVTCEEGVSILDQRDLNSGKKMANDAAYTLAMHLLAAQLNFAAGAESCQEAQDAALAAENLLVAIGFDGTGKYLRPKDPEYRQALDLAYTLDEYNNGYLCGP
jgi:hypothetical protein